MVSHRRSAHRIRGRRRVVASGEALVEADRVRGRRRCGSLASPGSCTLTASPTPGTVCSPHSPESVASPPWRTPRSAPLEHHRRCRPPPSLRRIRLASTLTPRDRGTLVRIAHRDGRDHRSCCPTPVPTDSSKTSSANRSAATARRAESIGRSRHWAVGRSGRACSRRARPRRVGAELAAIALVALFSRRRLGGYTGDVLGAAGVVGETVGLLALAVR